MFTPTSENDPHVPLEETLTPDNKQQMNEEIQELGSLLHDEWRAPRKQDGGAYEPRVKTTRDTAWIDAHHSDQVDIANSAYTELPADWQYENQASARVAMKEVWKAIANGEQLDNAFVEKASDFIHHMWLWRNSKWAPVELHKPYADLPEEEKEKDRAIIRKAIEIYHQHKQ